jgi:hypothetical protein
MALGWTEGLEAVDVVVGGGVVAATKLISDRRKRHLEFAAK